MKMLIDVSRLVGRLLKGRLPTGVDRVGLAYVRHYGPRARAVLWAAGNSLVCAPRESQAIFDWLLRQDNGGMPWSTIWRSLLPTANRAATAGSVLLNTGHTGLDDQRYVDMLQRRAVTPLLIIHDLIPITHPQFCRSGERIRHERRMRNALSVASGIICNSTSTLKALSEYCESIGMAMPPAAAAPLALHFNGSQAYAGPRSPFNLQASAGSSRFAGAKAPYFVLLSTIEPRKNHLMILQVWQRLVERHGADAPRLVLIGQRGWECEHVARLLDRAEAIRSFIIEKSHCGDDELTTLLAGAQALLFPTFTEGFGMPVIEALAQGVPVIASDLQVFREFAGDIPDYADPLDAPRWLELLESYCRAGSLQREAQLVRMKGFECPTWEGHFALVDRLLERIQGVARVQHEELVHA
jgi:glycosyltransferase involved in cell wall biosynthesis